MIILTVDEMIKIHEKLIEKTGGLDGLRDRAPLETAVFIISSGLGEIEYYPTTEEKAAKIAITIANHHGFLDGNKRIGLLLMLMTLKLNHIDIKYIQQELIDLGLGVADGSIDYKGILKWILDHK